MKRRMIARISKYGLCGCAALLVLSVCLLFAPVHPEAATAELGGYILGPQDKIRLKVYEWRANVETVFEWTSLNGEFVVGASGTVSLPLLGEIPAAGLTPAALAKDIGERLKKQISLSIAPNVAAEVVQYRPFYILGVVNKPGEYPYRPDLTVLQALSIAGGLTGSGTSAPAANRDVLAKRGDVREAETETTAFLARKARLEAEVNNTDKLQLPPELEPRKTMPAVALVLQQERLIFDTRRNALKAQVEVMNQLKAILQSEIEAIEVQIKSQQTEEDTLKKDLANIASLVNKGLTAAPRQLELERALARAQGEKLRLQAALLKAKQDIARAEAEIIERRSRFASDAAAELRDTQLRLEQALTKYDTASKQIAEWQALVPQSPARMTRPQPVYTIVRVSGGQRKELAATELTRVEPGDTIKVELPLDEPAAAKSATQ